MCFCFIQYQKKKKKKKNIIRIYWIDEMLENDAQS